MSDTINTLVKKKNDWLSSHVAVKYPTAESIKGRDLYLKEQQDKHYTQISLSEFHASLSGDASRVVDEVHLVDFHRLTIMYALTMASSWHDEQENAFLLEFFAQIILSDDYPLYVGFKQGKAVACAITHQLNDVMLISDVTFINSKDGHKQNYIAAVLKCENVDINSINQLVIEK